jgi:hypothetical protein
MGMLLSGPDRMMGPRVDAGGEEVDELDAGGKDVRDRWLEDVRRLEKPHVLSKGGVTHFGHSSGVGGS